MTVVPISFSVGFCDNFLIGSVVFSAGQGLAARAIALGVKESCQLCGNCLIGGVEVSGRERLHSFA